MESEATIIGDASKLEKVFTNIIDNACKYSSKNTPVVVTVSLKAGFVVISIKDSGKGIEESDIPHIFEGHHKGASGEAGGRREETMPY
jgi:signal transduction histidine kinase